MKKVLPVLALLLIIGLCARFNPQDAQAQSGGFPSQPTFLNVTSNPQSVNGPGYISNNNNAGGVEYVACGTSNALNLKCWDMRVGSTGTLTFGTMTDAGVDTTSTLQISKDNSQNFTGITLPQPGATGSTLITGSCAVSGICLNLTGTTNAANAYLEVLQSGTASGFSSGLSVSAGTTAADVAFQVRNASDSNIMVIDGSGFMTYTGRAPFIGMEAQLTNATTQVISCQHCQASPTAVRNGVGDYTLQPDSTGSFEWACSTMRQAGGGAVGVYSQILNEPSGGVRLNFFTFAGAAADPPVNTVTNCIGIR